MLPQHLVLSDATRKELAADAALLRGNVPSPDEWLQAWSMLSETVSIRKGCRMEQKRTAAPQTQGLRKRVRKQLTVMAEVCRVKIRAVLREATVITLALDASKYRKVVRFRCDRPGASGAEAGTSGAEAGSGWAPCKYIGASGFCQSGIMGILDCTREHTADFEADHAVMAVKQLDAFLTKFCTPLGKKGEPLAPGEGLKQHILTRVACISADGASSERRAILLAGRELFPRMLIAIRDSAHAIRIAYARSLHSDAVFGSVWEELFNKRHALVPDIMHSDKWRNLLEAIQEDYVTAVAVPGLPGQTQPLAGVLRNLAFAKIRFDSTARPVAKVYLLRRTFF